MKHIQKDVDMYEYVRIRMHKKGQMKLNST